MEGPVESVEFEMMILGRHSLLEGRQRSGSTRLDRSAYTILSRMSISGPMSIGQLSEAFGLDASTLNRQTAALMRAGLAERIPDPDGGIARKFRLTAKGRRMLKETRDANVDGLERVFKTWSRADIETFAALLMRYNGDIERIWARVWPRPGSES
nr:MarR family winged helix-turn-helix transcriptional regulator [Spelaeicoccus albus]